MRKALSSASKESVHFSRRAVARAMIVIILLRDDDIIRATYVRTLARGEKLADEAVHGGGLLVITMARWSPAELRQLRAPLVPDLREAVDEDDGQRLALADPVQRCSGRR